MDIKKKILEDSSIKKIYDLLVSSFPLITNGTIEIRAISYKKGFRVLIAVSSNDPNVSAIGGLTSDALEKIEQEIEAKITFILWNDNPSILIGNAMDDLFVSSIELDEKNKIARVKVEPDNMYYYENGVILELAKELTGWNIELI